MIINQVIDYQSSKLQHKSARKLLYRTSPFCFDASSASLFSKKSLRLWKHTKSRDENLLNCWGRRGAKECTHMYQYTFHYPIFNFGSFRDACKSDRSRLELSRDYLVFTSYLQKQASIQPRTSPLITTRSPKPSYAYTRSFFTRSTRRKNTRGPQ